MQHQRTEIEILDCCRCGAKEREENNVSELIDQLRISKHCNVIKSNQINSS